MKIKIRKLVIFSGTLFRWFELLINYYKCFTLFFKVGTMSGNLVVTGESFPDSVQGSKRLKTKDVRIIVYGNRPHPPTFIYIFHKTEVQTLIFRC